MCVIAVYEKGLALNMSELERCFTENPHGAGLMYQVKDHVHIEKGFMHWNEFKKAVEELPTDVDRVFHFRIATSGKISGACCHPFPICDDYKRMSRLSCDTPTAFAHNGILEDFTPAKGMKDIKSDTMVFNKEVLYPLGNTIENEAVRGLIEMYTTSRFAIMTPKKVYMLGAWEQSRESGAFYSNNSYGFRTNIWDDCRYVSDYEWEEDYSQYARLKDTGYDYKDIDNIICAFENSKNAVVYDYVSDSGSLILYFDGKVPSTGTIQTTIKGKKKTLPYKTYLVNVDEDCKGV